MTAGSAGRAVAPRESGRAIPPGRVLGLDLGQARIGVAVSDSDRRVATPVAVVRRRGDRVSEHREIAGLAADHDAVGLVVGLPLSLSGEVGPAARRVLEEIPELGAACGLPVDQVDERFSTVSASRALRAGGRNARRQRDVIDSAAAAELLQTWLGLQARRGNGS